MASGIASGDAAVAHVLSDAVQLMCDQGELFTSSNLVFLDPAFATQVLKPLVEQIDAWADVFLSKGVALSWRAQNVSAGLAFKAVLARRGLQNTRKNDRYKDRSVACP